MTDFIYLASKSPRRKELLTQIGVEFEVINASIEEVHQKGESPLDYVLRLATEKAQAGWRSKARVNDIPVLGADTVVVLNDDILEKPSCERDGKAMLKALSGNTHIVYTGICLCMGERLKSAYSKTEVTFAQMSDADVDWYWKVARPDDKAGAYGIQDQAARFVSNIKGSYTGVVGLPLFETSELLKSI